MKCISSPALDDALIMRYVEGEGDDEVASHIRECPYCREKATTWTSLQNRLQKQLYRVSCPTPMELGDYHLRLLPAPQVLVIAQHLRECPLCRREVAELEDFLADPAEEIGLFGSVKVLVARLISGREGNQEHGMPAFTGLRGEGDEPLIYQANNVRIAIEIQDDVELMGRKTLLGLVTGLRSSDFTIQLIEDGQVIATSSVDETGNFFVPDLSPGDYRLILSDPTIQIHVQSLRVM